MINQIQSFKGFDETSENDWLSSISLLKKNKTTYDNIFIFSSSLRQCTKRCTNSHIYQLWWHLLQSIGSEKKFNTPHLHPQMEQSANGVGEHHAGRNSGHIWNGRNTIWVSVGHGKCSETLMQTFNFYILFFLNRLTMHAINYHLKSRKHFPLDLSSSLGASKS
jgi:hypothetical protein